jgi:peroxiredoxin
MRLPEVLGVIGALVVGAVLAAFLLSSALGEQPALPTPVPPSLAPLPSLARVSLPPATAPASGPLGSTTPGAALVVGQKAPALEVTLLDGSTMNTDDFLGKPMWISFMTTWTPQTPAELQMMSDYAGLLGDQMNELVIDVGEDPQTVKSFIKAQKFDLPVGVDSLGIAQSAWGAYALPVHYLLDETGIVQDIVYGGAPPAIFIQAITDVAPDFSAEAPTPVPSLVFTLPPDTPPPAGSPTPAQ